MRILSQDNNFDIEYENCHLVANEKCCEIEAETNNPNFTPVMASYSSVEKCRKAMEMLHEAYQVHFMYETMTTEQKALFLTTTSEKEREYICGVFRFQNDAEIEV